MNKILAVIFIFVLSSCGLEKNIKSEDFRYSFSEGFCETGEHTFASQNAMCSALQNNSINNGCAQAARQNYFYANCSGSFVPN